jgi:hypothetical protein
MSRHRIVRTVALGLALAALAAPAAGAQGQDLRSPDSRDAAEGRGTFNSPDVTVVRLPAQPAPAAEGVDWLDAGVGAGGAVVVILLSAGGAYAVAHRRRGPGSRAVAAG